MVFDLRLGSNSLAIRGSPNRLDHLTTLPHTPVICAAWAHEVNGTVNLPEVTEKRRRERTLTFHPLRPSASQTSEGDGRAGEKRQAAVR
ncbi:hypothetical protein RRG08_060163 [Elysia crispata]|uniref:Uncharacterized protein n=1 Tax=Elysia crispata TaxID=231223 RepID=A0AAE1A098_9GAST|nr:hypothetical protein RRG08_060163 [Elysia crispata]